VQKIKIQTQIKIFASLELNFLSSSAQACF